MLLNWLPKANSELTLRDTSLTAAAGVKKHATRFAALMDLYEQNYILIRLLAPNLRNLAPGQFVSRVYRCLPLYLEVIGQEKYTTTLILTYRFQNGVRYPKQPDLMVRVYHDANTAEVACGLLHGRRHCVRVSRALDNSRKSNRFLFKWLRYCLHRGHLISDDVSCV